MVVRVTAARLLFIAVVVGAAASLAGTPGVVASADGTPIAYEVHGSGEPTLVLVHGWNCDSRYWREQVPVFSLQHRVVTVDLAGHGHSGVGREDCTMRSFGEDVRAVVDAVGGDTFVLVGHSSGGAVIAEAARLLPGRVLGLIGVDTLENVEYPVTEEFIEQMVTPFEADFAVACRGFAGEMIVPETDAALRDWIVEDMASAPPASAVSALRGYLTQMPTGEAAAIFEELPLPVVTVNTGAWPIDHEANRRHMHSFEAIVLEGTDHFMMLSRAEDFNRAFADAIEMVTRPHGVFVKGDATVEVSVLNAEKRLRQAMLDSDVAALDELLAENLVFTNHLGMTLGKQDDIGAHEAGIVDITELDADGWQVDVLGDDAAVVTVGVRIVGTFQGEPASGDFRFTRVWRKDGDGRWQVVVGHSSLVAAP